MTVPLLDGARREAVALALCACRGDQAGADAIIAGADLNKLMFALAQLTAEALVLRAVGEGCPPDLAGQAVDDVLTRMLQT